MRVFLLGIFLLFGGLALQAQMQLGDSKLDFASAEEGKKLLTQQDEFVKELSAFDRAARLRTGRGA